MGTKIGRNEPCPCGSGKKYKFCCGAGVPGANVIRFPGASGGDCDGNDDDFQRYQAYVESGQAERDGNVSFMEFMGKPNAATNASKTLQEAMREQSFSSQEEMETFMERHVQERNNRPIEDFQGLSPKQMSDLINAKSIADLDNIVTIRMEYLEEEAAKAPLMRVLIFVLSMYRDNGGSLEITKSGNYKRALVKRVAEDVLTKEYASRTVLNEPEVQQLFLVHEFLLDKDLISDSKTRSTLTPEGEAYTLDFDIGREWMSLLDYLLYERDWQLDHSGLGEPNPLYDIIQNGAVFSLFLLSKQRNKAFADTSIYHDFATAFPAITGNRPYIDIDIPQILHSTWFLYFFCQDMGLASRGHLDAPIAAEEARVYRTTPLFKKAFIWKL